MRLGEYIHQQCLVNLGIRDQLSDTTQFAQQASELEERTLTLPGFFFSSCIS